MTVAAQILNRVARTLFDEANSRWTEVELLEALSDAQKEVALLKPSAYTKNEEIQLVPGTLQSIPSDGVIFIDLSCNMGSGGGLPGCSITQIDRTVLESVRPLWRSEDPDTESRHFLFDDRDPTRFEVYPPQPPNPGFVQLMYGASPPEVTSTTDTLSISPVFDTAMYYLVLARCFSKTTGTQDQAKSNNYQQMAYNLIAGQKQAKQQLHPEQPYERSKR